MFLNNLSSIVGANKLAVQGVDYDADIAGFLGNLIGAADKGVVTMADLVTRVSFTWSIVFLHPGLGFPQDQTSCRGVC